MAYFEFSEVSQFQYIHLNTVIEGGVNKIERTIFL
jgi:hypothetical protein